MSIEEIKQQMNRFDTVEDVKQVLRIIGKPGENREEKRKAIEELFTSKSPQGFTTLDTIEDYEEY